MHLIDLHLPTVGCRWKRLSRYFSSLKRPRPCAFPFKVGFSTVNISCLALEWHLLSCSAIIRDLSLVGLYELVNFLFLFIYLQYPVHTQRITQNWNSLFTHPHVALFYIIKWKRLGAVMLQNNNKKQAPWSSPWPPHSKTYNSWGTRYSVKILTSASALIGLLMKR